MTRRVTVTINPAAIANNFEAAKARAGDAEIYCVLKADAYGHGAVSTALTLQPLMHSHDGFCVATPEEAHELRDHGITQPVLVLQGAMSDIECDRLAQRTVQCVVHDESQCRQIESRRTGSALGVWVKVDTGMGRLGFLPAELSLVIQRLEQCQGVQVLGVLSHLACADVAGNQHTRKQIALFRQTMAQHSNLKASLANSAALVAWPDVQFDRVRPGIMLYGVNPLGSSPLSPHPQALPSLQPAMQVTAPLIAIKQLQRGDGIGYGQTYRCPDALSAGVVAIGYRDGFPREATGATVSINGIKAPVLGRTSMDSIIVNLCGITAGVGNEVVIVGAEAPVEMLAGCAGTIGYDLLCRFSR